MFFGGGIPFDFGGGFPGGRGPFGGGPSNEKIDNEKFYNVLGVDKNADTQTIKKAYRKLALACHPDRGGDAEKFKELSLAYETLSDPEKRATYDKFGEGGLDKSGGGADFDPFTQFFGGGSGGSRQPREKKGEDVIHNLKATLSQLYSGFTKNMQLKKKILCRTCNGHGAPQTSFKECVTCKGKGRVTFVTRMGPMIQQQTGACNDCKGQGKSLVGKKCGDCDGQGKSVEKKVLEVFCPKNAPNKHKIVFRGDGDENINETPGDVIFIINEEKHDIFSRKGDDLFMNKKISLLEALTGVKTVVEQLDARKLLIQTKPGSIIKPGQHMKIADEGMPRRNNIALHGSLIITFEVDFPLSLSPDNVKSLHQCLPSGAKLTNKESECEVHYLEETTIDAYAETNEKKTANEAYDDDEDYEDEEGHGGAPRMQCQQA